MAKLSLGITTNDLVVHGFCKIFGGLLFIALTEQRQLSCMSVWIEALPDFDLPRTWFHVTHKAKAQQGGRQLYCDLARTNHVLQQVVEVALPWPRLSQIFEFFQQNSCLTCQRSFRIEVFSECCLSYPTIRRQKGIL